MDDQLVQLHRTYDDYTTVETLPYFLAKFTLDTIPHSEPKVRRAKIVRSSAQLDAPLMAQLLTKFPMPARAIAA